MASVSIHEFNSVGESSSPVTEGKAGKGKDVIVCDEYVKDVVVYEELKKQLSDVKINSNVGNINIKSIEQEISEVDNSFKEFVGKIEGVVGVWKKMNKSWMQYNLPFFAIIKNEIDEYNQMIESLKRKHDETRIHFINSREYFDFHHGDD